MITNFKVFESHKYEKYLMKFFEDYEKDKGIDKYYNYSDDYAKRYKLPVEIFEEFSILYYFYDNSHYKQHEKSIENYIKKSVKKIMLESIIKKIDDDINVYDKLKSALDKKPNFANRRLFGSIHNMNVKYIFFLLHGAIKNAPITKAINNYNL